MILVITTARSSLQASISLADNQTVAIICKQGGAHGHSQSRQLLCWAIDLTVHGRGEKILEVMNLQPMLYLMMQPLIFVFHRFKCVLDWFRNVGSCGMSNVLGLVVGYGIRTALWLRRSREAIGEEDDSRI